MLGIAEVLPCCGKILSNHGLRMRPRLARARVKRVFPKKPLGKPEGEYRLDVMFRFALRMTNNPEEAEVAVQDACLSLVKNGKNFETVELGYLLGIVGNKVRDIWRKKKQDSNLIERLKLKNYTDDPIALSPEEEITFRSLPDELRKKVEFLTHASREIFLFISHPDVDPSSLWDQWAPEHGCRRNDKRARGAFYQRMTRLRRECVAHGIYGELIRLVKRYESQ